MLQVLQPQLRQSDPGVAAAALAALGELAVVGGDAVRPFMPELLPLLLPLLQDHASLHKRRAALRALSQLLRSTGCAAEAPPDGSPLPSELLLATLLGMLKSEHEPSTRLELLRALGVLGACDPSTWATLGRAAERRPPQHASLVAGGGGGGGAAGGEPDAVAAAALGLGLGGAGVAAGAAGGGVLGGGVGAARRSLEEEEEEELGSSLGPSHEDFYPTVTLRALTRVLRDASLLAYHGQVIAAIGTILQSLRLKCVPYLPAVMPLLLQASRSGEEYLREVVVLHLAQLVGTVGQHVRVYLPSLLALAREHLRAPSRIQIHCIQLVEQLAIALNDEFREHLSPLIPQLLAILHADRSEGRLPSRRVLHALDTFGRNLQPRLYLVVPAVLRLCEHAEAPPRARRHAVRLLGRLCARLDLRDFASRLVHSLSRVLAASAHVAELQGLQQVSLLAVEADVGVCRCRCCHNPRHPGCNPTYASRRYSPMPLRPQPACPRVPSRLRWTRCALWCKVWGRSSRSSSQC